MAKILYGIMGNTYGHVMRTRSILTQWKGHEIYIVGGRRVPESFRNEYPVHEVPVLRTVHKNQHVDLPATIGQIATNVISIPKVVHGIRKVIDEWQPDLAICDREFYLPHACRLSGLRCISLNHSHVLMCCKYPVPSGQRISWSLAMINDRLLFDYTKENLVVSFYHPPIKKGSGATLFPPVVRTAVKDFTPKPGHHILVYQTSPTFGALIECLKKSKRQVIVYGFRNEHATDGNITFRPFDNRTILEDLSSCAYAVVNGGHNLISEALYFKKPVMCFPIANLFEQYLNAWHVRELGYGDFSTTLNPDISLFDHFEKNLPSYLAQVEKGIFDGTPQLVNHLEKIVSSL